MKKLNSKNGVKKMHRFFVLFAVIALCASFSLMVQAGTEGKAQKRQDIGSKDGDNVQRTPRGVFDQQGNVVSDIDFQTTNYGIFGFDVRNGRGGTFWPRGRRNQYLFAGGAWFGCLKRPPGSSALRKRVAITYNPNSGLSWMVPGTIEEGDEVITSADEGINKYRTYFSTDFSTTEGVDFQNPKFPRWPVWDSSPSDTIRYNNYFGNYINDATQRFKSAIPKGPAFITQEDIFCVYKDTDLRYYEGGVTKRKAEGFPLGLQTEQMIYSWGFGDYADFLFIKYQYIHPTKFKDTLFDCWMGAVQDVDIALATNPVGGAQNDRARFYDEDRGLNLAVQWTNGDRGEARQGFGYLGFNFLESPSVQRDSAFYGVHFVDDNNGYAVGFGGRMKGTTDGGQTWFPRTNDSARVNLNGVHFVDARNGWVVGDSGKILRTTNGGIQWTNQLVPSASVFKDVYFADEQKGWAVGGGVGGAGIIFATANGGSSWTNQALPTTNSLRSVHFVNPQIGFAVGSDGTIVRTTDGGTSWTDQKGTLSADYYGVHFVDGQNGWAVGVIPANLSPVIVKTTNGGSSWTSQASGLPDSTIINGVHFANAQTGWIAGSLPSGAGFISVTRDGGNSWSQQSIDASVLTISALSFRTSNLGWAVGDFGTVLVTRDGGTTWVRQLQDTVGFLRTDAKKFPLAQQLGMRTMRNWPITVDPIENEDRYNFMSLGVTDGDNGPGDRRLMMATGPFNMRPGDTARIVVGLILGNTSLGGDATGTTADMAELIRKVKFAQFVYDNQFRAPQSPDLTVIRGAADSSATGVNSFIKVPSIGFLGLNNAIVIQWDSTAEMSIDTLERGLDFMGYRIYRARRTDQDTFAVDFQLNARKGPLAWKQVAQYSVPSPFVKDPSFVVGSSGVRIDSFFIADVIKKDQRRFLVRRVISNAEPWGQYFTNLFRNRPANYGFSVNSDSTIRTSGVNPVSRYPYFDRLDSIQYTYLAVATDSLPIVTRGPAPNRLLDTNAVRLAKDSLVRLILARKVRMEPFLFRDWDTTISSAGDTTAVEVRRPWEETVLVRKQLVAPYMRLITSGRTFFDQGDDDNNGVITYSADPERTEKLINNVNYYYAVRAFDEGDFLLPTPQKLNSRAVGLPNVVTTMPLAARPGASVSFEFVTDDANKAKLGGIFNVRLLVNDPQKFNALFAGKTLELEFFRYFVGYNPQQTANVTGDGLYGTYFVLRDSTTRNVLNNWISFLPPELCPTANVGGLPGYFSENSAVYVDTNKVVFDTVYTSNGGILRVDTTDFGLADSRKKIIRSGFFTSDASCFGNKYAYGSIGLAFDYAIEQWGGIYRADTGYVVSGPENAIVARGNLAAGLLNSSNILNPPPAYLTLPPGFIPARPFENTYNNGPGVYEVTFKEGGTENITTKFLLNTGDASDAGKDSTMTFLNVPYLEYDIKNVYEFERRDPRPDGTIGTAIVGYDFNLKPQTLNYNLIPPDQQVRFPNPEAVVVGNYGAASFGWRNSRNGDWSAGRMRFFVAEQNTGRPIGQELRYYQSRNLSTTGRDTLDFVNLISIGGAQFVIDQSQRGRKTAARAVVDNPPNAANLPKGFPTREFQPGDKVRFSTFGGAFGFPFDSAKAYIRVKDYDKFSATTGAQSYTSQDLEQVQVVPNPYYVTHEGIRSSFEGQLYFTRLPRVCTISIFTVNGDLIKTLEHNELTGVTPDKFATDVWNLISKNNQRVASQMLIAKIETPEGASVIRKFAIVVGPARIVGDGE